VAKSQQVYRNDINLKDICQKAAEARDKILWTAVYIEIKFKLQQFQTHNCLLLGWSICHTFSSFG